MNANHPLKLWRDAQRPPWSRARLAKALNVSTVTVWRWETGARTPEAAKLQQLVQLTGLPLADLIGIREVSEAAE